MKIRHTRGERNVLLGTSLLAAASLFGTNAATAADDKDNLEEVVVTGVRASLDNAQELKRASDQVIDSIVAEDIGKLPDNNVADALARVTGVQIRRDSGEGNAVLIRGLPNLTTLLNGREVFTTTARFIALADKAGSLTATASAASSRATCSRRSRTRRSAGSCIAAAVRVTRARVT